MTRMLWMVLCCAVATFVLRWLPLWQARRQGRSVQATRWAQRWLGGVGPAAIAALLAVSVAGVLGADLRAGRVACVALALLVIAGVRRLGGGIALPTLAGALAYGVLAQLGAG